jgi:hypothetical protein
MSEPAYFPVNLYLQKMVVIGFANSWLRVYEKKGQKREEQNRRKHINL